MITLGTVNISDKTKELMKKAMDEGMIGQGEYIQEFEKRLASLLEVKHVVAVANGTSADAAALAAAKYRDNSQRDEVIVPALTFIAQINAVYYNHLKPVFVDIGYDYQINAEKIEEKINENTLAIMPTHLLGRPAKMEKVIFLAKKYNLYVVEDACEALGSKYRQKYAGTIGDMGCFSFFPSHTITTGEGGAIATDSDDFAVLLRSIRNHGRQSNNAGEHYIFPYLGFNAKMNSMEAIIGLGIIDNLPSYFQKRRENLARLNKILDKDLFSDNEAEYIVPHCLPAMVESEEKRNLLLKLFPEKFGIEARQIFCSIPTQCPAYGFLGQKPGAYPVAEDVGKRGLYVPCHQNLSDDDLIKIANSLSEFA